MRIGLNWLILNVDNITHEYYNFPETEKTEEKNFKMERKP